MILKFRTFLKFYDISLPSIHFIIKTYVNTLFIRVGDHYLCPLTSITLSNNKILGGHY